MKGEAMNPYFGLALVGVASIAAGYGMVYAYSKVTTDVNQRALYLLRNDSNTRLSHGSVGNAMTNDRDALARYAFNQMRG